MSIKPDHWIEKMAREHGMIEPFEPGQVKEGVVSYGLSSYGYDIRVADEFKVFTNVNTTVVDPKNFDDRSFVEFKGDVCTIPPNSFALARTIEYFRIPRNVLTICVGKCLTGDTRVVDAETGNYLPLDEFVASQVQRVVALNNWSLGVEGLVAHTDNGPQPVYQLTTRAGLKVKATATHPFRTFQGWTPLANLHPGDRIAVARNCPVFGKAEWPEHEAVLLGLMLSDGQCCTPGHSPTFTTNDSRLAEVLTEAVRAFGCEVSPKEGCLGYRLVNKRGRGGIMEKNRIYAWLEWLGCNLRSSEKFVPSVVFKARRERVATFLQALFSGDGSVYSSGKGVFLEYSTTSERLAYDVRHLLLRFGIFALARSKSIPMDGKVYWLQITDRDMIQRFSDKIGFIPGSQKQKALDDIVSRLGPARKSNFDTMPPAAWGLMRDVVHASGHSLRSVGIRSTQPSQSLPYSIARQAAQVVDTPEFPALVDADVVWDTVKSVEPAGVERVYDLTVPGVHNFLANDLIVHNSTYARCGIIVNVTPFEPEWEGFVTLEISNTTPLPARIYANEGIAQVLFFQADEVCRVSYADKKGKYQKQIGITLPHINRS